jgi:hypothetical protein
MYSVVYSVAIEMVLEHKRGLKWEIGILAEGTNLLSQFLYAYKNKRMGVW